MVFSSGDINKTIIIIITSNQYDGNSTGTRKRSIRT
jgi:hypothetical protein